MMELRVDDVSSRSSCVGSEQVILAEFLHVYSGSGNQFA